MNGNAVERKHTWGLDLAGQNGTTDSRQIAGGIAGLLAVHQQSIEAIGESPSIPEANYVYEYDAIGNVGQLTNLAAASIGAGVVAAYESDPYGGTTTQSGSYVDRNPFRFRTTYSDLETGFLSFGDHNYSARMGRRMNRETAKAGGGANVYKFLNNSPTGSPPPALLALSAPDRCAPDEDSTGICVCSQQAGLLWPRGARHSCIWDPHANQGAGQSCGRWGSSGVDAAHPCDRCPDSSCGSGSSGGSGGMDYPDCDERGPGPGTACQHVDATPDQVSCIMAYCKSHANDGLFTPGFNDCHSSLDDAFKDCGVTPPAHPRVDKSVPRWWLPPWVPF